MRFGERVVVFIFRPIYRTFFDRLFWWFLARIKVFLLSDITIRLENIERRLQTLEADSQQRGTSIEERLRSAERNNIAQWEALEQLLLALFRQPELGASDPEWRPRTGQ
jgi:hypothetical protein